MASYTPKGSISSVAELAQTGLNANATTLSNSLDIGNAALVIFQVLANSGSHSTHVLTLQCSVDDTNWNDVSGATLTGVGVNGEITVASQYVRLKVTTNEGGASTVDIIIQAK